MRKMEVALGLPPGSTDREPTAEPEGLNTDHMAAIIRTVGELLEAETVSLPPRRFADLVAVAYADAMEHGGRPREAHLRSVVRLLKAPYRGANPARAAVRFKSPCGIAGLPMGVHQGQLHFLPNATRPASAAKRGHLLSAPAGSASQHQGM